MSATVLQIDFGNEAERHLLYKKLRQLRGVHRVEICKWRPRRSDAQNRFMWPCIVKPLGDFLREQGEQVTDDHCHEMLKHKFLRCEYTDSKTGEVITYTKSTTELNTDEFSIYAEQCMQWLAEVFGIICETPPDTTGPNGGTVVYQGNY